MKLVHMLGTTLPQVTLEFKRQQTNSSPGYAWLRNNTCQSLLWRHNGRGSVSNHQPYDYLLNRFFRRRSKKTSKLRDTGLCVGNSPVTGEFPAQMASNAENVSILWRHHVWSLDGYHCHRDTMNLRFWIAQCISSSAAWSGRPKLGHQPCETAKYCCMYRE